ncbi:MAG: hypothetical protein EP349_07320 [Alphaproteobacteria bacterium]|nr:MAG: hypothetical protein EP349_07320 [Alphaproteobacteria bacterium]
MTDENTRINWKHYLGKPFRSNAMCIITTFGLAAAGGISVGTNIADDQTLTPDTEGTAQQEAAYQNILDGITALEEGKTALEIAQKRHELGSLTGDLSGDALNASSREIDDMQRNFAFQGQGVLMDMLMHGTAGNEADISEDKVVELANLFTKKVGATSDFGVPLSVDKIAYLDEARQEMGKDGFSNNPVKDLQKLDSEMKSQLSSAGDTGFFSGVGTFFGLMLMLAIGVTKLEHWGKYEPRRVPARSKKKAVKH